LQAVAEQTSTSPQVLVFRTRMGAQAPLPPDQPQPQPNQRQTDWHDPQRHGSKAAIAAAVFAFIAAIAAGGTFYVNWSNRSDQTTQQAQKQADARTNDLITNNPKVKELSDGLETLTSNVVSLSTDISNLKKAVQTLADNQSKQTQKIIDRILHAAQTSSPKIAAQLVDTAASLIAVSRQERIPADPQYFKSTVADLQNLSAKNELANPVLSARLALAAYRSSLESRKGVPSNVPPSSGGIIIGPHQGVEAMTINGEQLTGNIIGLASSSSGKLSDQTWVKDANLIGGSQLLDGIYWENVTFVGMRIRYNSGETGLKGVRFINCTFDFTPSTASAELADAIALNPTIASMMRQFTGDAILWRPVLPRV
jgi:hypothetical protein